MDIIPSIDIRGGNVVRLYRGDYENETIFPGDPVDVALRWQSMGAMRIHIVDLDGAASGVPVNIDIINRLAAGILVPLQIGGGIRSIETIEHLLRAGVERVILGTVAVENPTLVEEACRRFGDCMIVGIDTRNGKIAVKGWKEDTELTAVDFARSMVKLGVKRFIHTDITRDGTLTEPNFSAFSELVNAVNRPVVAAGGVTKINHLVMLKKLGAEGAIIGKALYTGDIKIKDALRAVE